MKLAGACGDVALAAAAAASRTSAAAVAAGSWERGAAGGGCSALRAAYCAVRARHAPAREQSPSS